MHHLWLSIFLSLLICFTSVSMPLNPVAHDGSATDNTSDCNPVPYPFGAPGVAFEGFEVVCRSTTTRNRTKSYMPFLNSTQLQNPSLKLPTGTYLIQNISLQGQVRILTGPIYEQCYDSGTEALTRGTEALTRGTGWLNLTGTPFTLSTNDTTFVALGCDDVVMVKGFVGDGNGGGRNFTSYCVSICSNPSSTIDGYSSGLGFCQIPLPGPGGLKSFELNLHKFQNTGMNRFSNCSAAFFATHKEFSFKTPYFDDKRFFLDGQAEHVAVLNWAIGDKSCKEAKNDVNSFACKKNSQCYDSPNGVGYFCNCSQGYEGNPYVQGGCSDVDECHAKINPCIGHCINTEGSVKCPCPSRMTGDGKKDGTGCSKIQFWFTIVGACVRLLILVLVICCCTSSCAWCLQKRKIVKRRKKFFKQNGGHLLQQRLASQGINSETKIFTGKELKKATENYSENHILGQGGYGTVYKGTLSDLKVVAIKKSKIEDENRIEQFINEIIILSKINHRNVVKLLGCCLETQVPLLVYEFIPNGTLLHLIHGQNSGYHLTWDCRLRISAEAAGAVAYLHSAASFPIIHRDIKSSNILLDENFTAKVSDFGASRSVPFDKTHVTTLIQGTFGYLDPEYFLTSQLTEKSDVYSFGVVLAELLTGEKPISFDRPEEFHNLAMYFTVAFDEGRFLQVIDPPVASEAGAEELYATARLTRQCLNTKGEERPTMKEVSLELEALSRMRNQQNQRGNEEIQQLLAVGNLSNSEIVECTKQYSLEVHMLSSMDLPR